MRIGIVHLDLNQAEFLARAARGAELSPELLSPAVQAEALVGFQALVLLTPLTNPETFMAVVAMAKTGTPVLGIGAGAATLFIGGLVPGIEDDRAVINLTANDHQPTHRVRVRLAKDFQRNAFTLAFAPQAIVPLTLSVSNAAIDIPPGLLIELKTQGLNVLTYCDEQGMVQNTPTINPVGSCDCIAAVSNKAGNVLAMLPALDDADAASAIFQSLHDYLDEGYFEPVLPLAYYPRR